MRRLSSDYESGNINDDELHRQIARIMRQGLSREKLQRAERMSQKAQLEFDRLRFYAGNKGLVQTARDFVQFTA